MISQEQKDVLNKYAEFKAQVKLWEVQVEALAPKVLEIMQANEVEEVDIAEKGKLSLGSRRAWKYSQKLQDLEKSLKEEKKVEEQTGKADYVEKHYVIFKPLTEEE